MKCPHCLQGFHSKKSKISLGEDPFASWAVAYETCPECKRFIIELVFVNVGRRFYETRLVYPKGIARAPVSTHVPDEFAGDYKEACLVLADSPKASAALSRRCLQNVLREKASIKDGSLADEIQQVLDSKQLPSYLANPIDTVRNIGNFAAHPIKSANTGEIVDVELGEAEWNLNTLEGLFDFYFVQPEILKEKRKKLDDKLKDAGKHPTKSP